MLVTWLAGHSVGSVGGNGGIGGEVIVSLLINNALYTTFYSEN